MCDEDRVSQAFEALQQAIAQAQIVAENLEALIFQDEAEEDGSADEAEAKNKISPQLAAQKHT